MVGQTLSHYRIIEKIGQGGMGEVYRAEDTSLKREVAIKVLPEQFTQDPQRLARFERETGSARSQAKRRENTVVVSHLQGCLSSLCGGAEPMLTKGTAETSRNEIRLWRSSPRSARSTEGNSLFMLLPRTDFREQTIP